MASLRVQEQQEQENARRAGQLTGKENVIAATSQLSLKEQMVNKRAVLGLISNNFARNKQQQLLLQQQQQLKQQLKSKSEICKDDKYSKAKTSYVPANNEPFTIYEEKVEEPLFQIYEDDGQTETEIVSNIQETDKIEIQLTTEVKVTHEKESESIPEVESPKDEVERFQNVLKEIEITRKDERNDEEAHIPKESPMSLDRSLLLTESGKKDSRSKREACKTSRSNLYDIEEYRADIYHYFRNAEVLHRPKPGYMKKQPDINYSMRTILVDWLVEVAEEYRLNTETLYLAVSYIDRFLSYMSVVRAKLQLVGTAAMFIAAKYEEIYPPEVSEFVYITDDTYTKKQVLRMEHLILRVLSFDLTVPTPLAFLMDYCISNNLSEKVQHLAMYLCELSLLEADPYLQFLPSNLAASSVALARHTFQEEPWPHELELCSGYSLQDLKPCISCLHKSFKNAPNLPQQAIQEKYKSNKYHHVALLLPRSSEPFDGEDSESA